MKKPNKKPTMLEMKDVINGMLRQLDLHEGAIMQIDSSLYGFIKFSGKEKEYKEWMIKKAKEAANGGKGPSSGDNEQSDKRAKRNKASSKSSNKSTE